MTLIDDAINQLQTESAEWQRVVQELAAKLIAAGESVLAEEVKRLLDGAIQDTFIESQCYADFLRDRMREDLMRLRAELTGEAITLTPRFCKPYPAVLDMRHLPPYLSLHGYNLDFACVRATLINTQGERADVSALLTTPSPYLMTMPTSGPGSLPLAADSERLELKEERGKPFTIDIIQPEVSGRVHTVTMVGSVMLIDKGLRSHVKGYELNESVVLTSAAPVARYSGSWLAGVGDKVRGSLDITYTLEPSLGDVTVTGGALIYGGAGARNEKNGYTFNTRLPPAQDALVARKLSHLADSFEFSLRFTNLTKLTLQARADTYIRNDLAVRANDNYGHERVMVIGTSRSGAADAMRSLLSFDLANICGGIKRATLQLTVHSFGRASSSPFNVGAYRVLAPWQEGNGSEDAVTRAAIPGTVDPDTATGVAWAAADRNNQAQPAIYQKPVAVVTINQSTARPGTVFEWDITPLVQQWLRAPETNFGLMLCDVTTGGTFRELRLGTREGSDFPKLAGSVPGPRLVLEFSNNA